MKLLESVVHIRQRINSERTVVLHVAKLLMQFIESWLA